MRPCAWCGFAMDKGEGLPYPGDYRVTGEKRVHWNCHRTIELIAKSPTIEMERNARQVEERGT